MAQTTSTYLTLKRASALLGVHAQTLRSWEKQGLIRMVRLPRSGYRRVPATEVERLQGIMSANAPAAGVLLIPPRRDEESVAQAQAMADEVRAQLQALEDSTQFDELMEGRRGRTWLPLTPMS